MLQGNKNKTYRGRWDRLSVSIGTFPVFNTRAILCRELYFCANSVLLLTIGRFKLDI